MNIPTYKSSIIQVKAYKIMQAKVNRVLEQYSLTSSEWSILGMVFEQKNGIRFSDVADILLVERPHVTILVEILEKKELLEVHAHPKDKRAKLLFLTAKAKQLIPKIEIVLKNELEKLMQDVTEEEWETYKHVLEVIIANGS